MKKLILTCGALIIGASAGTAMAKDVQEFAISKIQYKNKGAYDAAIEVRFKVKTESGKTVTCTMVRTKSDSKGSLVSAIEVRTYDLRTKSFFFAYAQQSESMRQSEKR